MTVSTSKVYFPQCWNLLSSLILFPNQIFSMCIDIRERKQSSFSASLSCHHHRAELAKALSGLSQKAHQIWWVEVDLNENGIFLCLCSQNDSCLFLNELFLSAIIYLKNFLLKLTTFTSHWLTKRPWSPINLHLKSLRNERSCLYI